MKTNTDYVSWLKIFLITIIIIINIFETINITNDKEINFVKTTSSIILPSVPKIIKVNDTTNINNDKEVNINNNNKAIETFYGNVSHYGPDCRGCCGKTATGYNVNNGNIYYNDQTYGLIRIAAADKSLPFGSIIRIQNNNQNIIAIVLDRGGGIGFNKKFAIDLLTKNERESTKLGVLKNSKIEVLRYGY